MKTDEKVQRIILWRECLATMDESFFFDIMRMYLGEIKTPYNKQKLIESLSSFLRKSENKEKILMLLGEKDLKILTIIKSIHNCSRKKLLAFVEGKIQDEKLLFDLNEHLQNLCERLILFIVHNKENAEDELCINPLLEDEIEPLLSTKLLFSNPHSEKEETSSQENFFLTDNFLISFITFITSHPDLCKNDSSIKKQALKELMQIFPEVPAEFYSPLTTALLNLGILNNFEKGTFVDFTRLEQFSALSFKAQRIYLATAAVAHFPRKTMYSKANLFFNTLLSIPKEGCSLLQFSQLYLLQKEQSGAEENSRFERMIYASDFSNEGSDSQIAESGLAKAFARAAVSLGIICASKKDLEKEGILKGASFLLEKEKPSEKTQNVLSMDAGFSVTLMPGLSLKELLPVAKFLELKHFDTAASFELNRKSCIRSFDFNFFPKEIFSFLEKYSSYEIPESLKVSVEEWFNSYNSICIYKGFILKVEDEQIPLVKKNPVFKRFIRRELAEGIFLMNFTSDAQAENVIQKSGFDFIGKLKTFEEEKQGIPFLPIDEDSVFENPMQAEKKIHKVDLKKQKDFLDELKSSLDSMNLPKDQKEALLDRINRKIILNKNQLAGSSVRFEKVEAGGMDYTGKIHVIESALQNGGILQIELEGGNRITGTPIELNKKVSSAFVVIQIQGQEKISVQVSSIVRLKKTRRLLNLD